MALLTKTILENLENEFNSAEPEWKLWDFTEEDMKFLKEECSTTSEFDPLNKRNALFNDLLNQKAILQVKECKFGKVVVVYENMEQINDLPWGLWGRILRIYTDSHEEKPFKIYLLANTHLREFPSGHKPIRPENINGGYTYRCNRQSILIYRAEDATRVLLHELLHSACTDNPENDVDTIEAETEAWAEFIYICILSRGVKHIFNDLLKRQSEWIIKQNNEVRKHMKNPDSREFPWRYTIGKEEVWRRWGILKEGSMAPPIKLHNSLRLTYPPNNILKERFDVDKRSTML